MKEQRNKSNFYKTLNEKRKEELLEMLSGRSVIEKE